MIYFAHETGVTHSETNSKTAIYVTLVSLLAIGILLLVAILLSRKPRRNAAPKETAQEDS